MMFCHGGVDEWNCPLPDQCYHNTYDTNGDKCQMFCPVHCSIEQVHCPGLWDEKGCQMSPDICLASYTEGVNGTHCATHCPVNCPPDMMFCHGGVDEWNCPLPDQCYHNTFDTNGDKCQMFCPVHCSIEQVHCPGLWDEKGCQMSA